ncbi:MAG: hypothetical protein ACE5GQ_06750 [Nitrospinales bacterium]
MNRALISETIEKLIKQNNDRRKPVKMDEVKVNADIYFSSQRRIAELKRELEKSSKAGYHASNLNLH